ncbi:HD domain-containing protein [Acuticoccus sp. MNP-M23]|uniref:HD domain-containing protein n=1 Tax=Acuticoccus sp. MNP-M23 TaxID=3072793 RepID=UPI0028161175|nr:HD domain-containing protein [Acuticoccus sp. MNP-M23]WMS43982.1 HD domain-containing protein [Acuticoccus sp. MNP-M23]
MTAPSEALTRRLAFLAELEKLKSVMRQSRLVDGSRRENTAEHSWHLAMFAMVLAPHAANVDTGRVIEMLLVHDIVEIDAGDVPYHQEGKDLAKIAAAEETAASRLFGLLPEGEGQRLRALWDEFEAARTPEARFAKGLDRLQPVLLNLMTDGGTWDDFAVTEEQVMARCGPPIEGASPELWAATARMVSAHFAARRAG